MSTLQSIRCALLRDQHAKLYLFTTETVRMIVGIVGSEAKKFTPITEAEAKIIITSILLGTDSVPVTGFTSGHCHLGGIDIWAEELAKALCIPLYIYPPKNLQWSTGYRPRNIQIAQKCDVLHNITVRALPPGYNGMRFPRCYHCETADHVKSGGCWTARYAEKLGKKAYWHIVG